MPSGCSVGASSTLLRGILHIIVVFLLRGLLSTSSLGNSLGVLLLLDIQHGKAPIQINSRPFIIEVMKSKTYVFVYGPVKDIIVLESFPYEQVPKDLAEVRVIGLVIEPQ